MTRFAYVFPGQGCQAAGMGHALFDGDATCQAWFEQVDRTLDAPISRLCFEGPEEELALTENTQPAILAVSLASLSLLEARGLRPDAAAGHSLGEYGALVAAGAIDALDALRTVRRRGKFMQDAVPVGTGAMAAILGLDAATVTRCCEQAAAGEVVSPANLNGPMQTVIAGHAAAVERAMDLARTEGARRAVLLRVSAPFHCELMAPAARKLEPLLNEIRFRDPSFDVVTNVDATAARSGSAARDALVRQVESPVRWHETIESMLERGIETFVEVGPGKVLAGLIRSIRRSARVLPAGDPESIEAVAKELAS